MRAASDRNVGHWLLRHREFLRHDVTANFGHKAVLDARNERRFARVEGKVITLILA